MKRTPIARHTQLQRATPTPGTVRAAFPARGAQSGHRPRAERIAGQKPPGNPIPTAVRRRVHDRDGMCCVRCGISVAHTARSIHHRQPRGAGGTRGPQAHRLSLLVLLCGTGTTGCHGWIESNRAEARALGWLISKFEPADPQTIPLRWSDLVDVEHPDELFLLDDGTRIHSTDIRDKETR